MDDLISRQTAIDALERIFDRCEEIEVHLPKGDPDRDGYKMYPDYLTVWKYLHQLSSANEESFEWCHDCKEYDQERHCCHRWTKVIRETVEELRQAQPERKTGEWIEFDSDEDKYDIIKCSCCKHIFTVDSYHWTDIGFVKDDFNFCPNCGADMRGE